MLRLGLLGAGRMAQVHARAIKGAGARIATVYDIDRAAAERLAAATSAPVASTAAAAICHSDVDAVLIASASATHVPLTLEAVKAGKPVMCEKPLAAGYEEAHRCVEQLGAEAARVFVAFNRRYDPGHRGLRERVAAGEIGTVEQLIITCRDPCLSSPAYVRGSGGVFRDMTVHDFDLARWILDEEPVSLFARGSAVVEPWVAEIGDVDSSMVMLWTASGKLAVIVNAKRTGFGFDQRIEVSGAGGILISDNPTRTALKRFGADGGSTPRTRPPTSSRASSRSAMATATGSRSRLSSGAWKRTRLPRPMRSTDVTPATWERRRPARTGPVCPSPSIRPGRWTG